MNPETYQPFSRGLVHHLPMMSDKAAKLYLYILLKVLPLGDDKGKLIGFVSDCVDDLGWNRKKWDRAVRDLSDYINYVPQKSRHEPFTITVKKYKNTGDFYVPQNGGHKNIHVPQNGGHKNIHVPQNGGHKSRFCPSNRVYVPQNGGHSVHVTQSKTHKINELQSPNNEIIKAKDILITGKAKETGAIAPKKQEQKRVNDDIAGFIPASITPTNRLKKWADELISILPNPKGYQFNNFRVTKIVEPVIQKYGEGVLKEILDASKVVRDKWIRREPGEFVTGPIKFIGDNLWENYRPIPVKKIKTQSIESFLGGLNE